MKKKIFISNAIIFILTAVVAVYVGAKIPDFLKQWRGPFLTGDYAEHINQRLHPITLYGTSTCKHCASARAYLNKSGIKFNDVIIDKSPELKKQYNLLEEKAVPIILSKDHMFVGFNEDKYKKFLEIVSK